VVCAGPGTDGDPVSRTLEYIEVTRADIEAAHAIAHEVLGRSLDELPPVTRKLLGVLSQYVAGRAKTLGVAKDELRFTRRELREACGWGDTQLRLHLQRLAELELLVSERGGPGGQVRYRLRQEEAADGRGRLCGLVDPAELIDPDLQSAATTAKSRGSDDEVAGQSGEVAAPTRGQSGPAAGRSRSLQTAAEPALMRVADKLPTKSPERIDRGAEPVSTRRTPYPQPAAA
jgi:hypothetical protein